MILDGHIHIRNGSEDHSSFRKKLQQSGVQGGLIISLPPRAFPAVGPSAPPRDRINNVLAWCSCGGELYPFYWIDPMEADALEQVAMAVKAGIVGFKVICDRYFPGDRKALKVFAAIAGNHRPILFHSGILWDGKPSSQYNRPVEFEALLGIKDLRFCLAHIAWPWCDELVALYGKILHARASHPDSHFEMFVDITPGTPPVYRREALTRLFTAGYDVDHNVMFGTDSCANDYNTEWVRQWIRRDRIIFKEIGLEQKKVKAVYAGNLRSFVGRSPARTHRQAPKPGY